MFDDLIVSNRHYADTRSGSVPAAGASRALAIVTCMDSRVDPAGLFELAPGEAIILRNAGARVTDDTIRSLVLATAILGVERVVVLQHTLCALMHTDDDALREQVGLDRGSEPAGFLAMPDPDAALKRDVVAVREHEAIRAGTTVEGWRYDLESGLVERIVS